MKNIHKYVCKCNSVSAQLDNGVSSSFCDTRIHSTQYTTLEHFPLHMNYSSLFVHRCRVSFHFRLSSCWITYIYFYLVRLTVWRKNVMNSIGRKGYRGYCLFVSIMNKKSLRGTAFCIRCTWIIHRMQMIFQCAIIENQKRFWKNYS